MPKSWTWGTEVQRSSRWERDRKDTVWAGLKPSKLLNSLTLTYRMSKYVEALLLFFFVCNLDQKKSWGSFMFLSLSHFLWLLRDQKCWSWTLCLAALPSPKVARKNNVAVARATEPPSWGESSRLQSSRSTEACWHQQGGDSDTRQFCARNNEKHIASEVLIETFPRRLTFGPWAASLQRWPQIVLFFQATLKSTRRLDSQTWSQGSWKCPCNLCWCIPKSSKIPFLCKLWFALHKLLHFPIIHELHCDINFSNVRFTLIQRWSTFHSIHLNPSKLRLFKIFQLKGTPTIETWPTLENLGHFSRSFPRWQAQNHIFLFLTLVTRTQ